MNEYMNYKSQFKIKLYVNDKNENMKGKEIFFSHKKCVIIMYIGR